MQRTDNTDHVNHNNVIEFSSSAAVLYGMDIETSNMEFNKLSVAACGCNQHSLIASLPFPTGVDFAYDNGLTYFNGGRVYNPETGAANRDCNGSQLRI